VNASFQRHDQQNRGILFGATTRTAAGQDQIHMKTYPDITTSVNGRSAAAASELAP